MASRLRSRQPGQDVDRGCRYTSEQFTSLAIQLGVPLFRSVAPVSAGTTRSPSRSSPPSNASCSAPPPGSAGPAAVRASGCPHRRPSATGHAPGMNGPAARPSTQAGAPSQPLRDLIAIASALCERGIGFTSRSPGTQRAQETTFSWEAPAPTTSWSGTATVGGTHAEAAEMIYWIWEAASTSLRSEITTSITVARAGPRSAPATTGSSAATMPPRTPFPAATFSSATLP